MNLSTWVFWPCYLGTGFLVWLGLPWVFHAFESSEPHALSLEDPYLLACLSGGCARVISTALAVLVDRGFLQVGPDRKVMRGPKFEAATSAGEVEACLLRFPGHPRDVDQLFADSQVGKAARTYQDRLLKAGLLLSFPRKCVRRLLVLIFTALVIWVAYKRFIFTLKVDIPEIGDGFYLLTLCLVIALLKRGSGSRTRMGNRILADMRLQFKDLKSRRSDIPPGTDADAVRRLGALFGLGSGIAS